LITGQAADYQFKLAIKDLDTFQELLLKRITGIPGGGQRWCIPLCIAAAGG
jgi:hypothetical protein